MVFIAFQPATHPFARRLGVGPESFQRLGSAAHGRCMKQTSKLYAARSAATLEEPWTSAAKDRCEAMVRLLLALLTSCVLVSWSRHMGPFKPPRLLPSRNEDDQRPVAGYSAVAVDQ